MSLTPGTKLGLYEITGALGAGGMGEVYRAKDTKLGREVAIKVLPADVAQDAERLKRGAIPVGEALEIAKQIAAGLEEAHEKGIVHRDLKPANIKLTPDGKVKVLDFGLAKAYANDASGAGSFDSGNSPTMTHAATMAGMILGTAAYMSPEQARGKPVDKRADIWAFGVVLYTKTLPATTPSAIRQLLRRCLERNPKNRLHDIADARIAIDDMARGAADEPNLAAPARARSGPAWLWPVIAVALLAAGAVAGRFAGRPEAAESQPVLAQFEIRAPEGTGFVRGIAFAPDGGKIAFVARGADGHASLWVRSLDSVEARQLGETAGARFPFWAPDSRRIGFFSSEGLKWTDSTGGSPVVIAPTSSVENVRGAAWGADNVIVYAPNFIGPLLSVSARGGAAAPGTRIPNSGEIGTNRFPSFLPDGRRFIFYASPGTGTEPGSLFLGRVGSLDARRLGPAHSTAVFAPPGYLIYARSTSIVAHRFDDKSEALVGEPVPIVTSTGSSLSVSGLRSIGASSNGTLIYRNDKRGSNQMVWVDRAGREQGTLPDQGSTWHYGPRLSPDGRFLAVSHLETRSGLGEIWIHDLKRNIANRLSPGAGDEYLPTWVRPAGREIVYNSARAKSPGGLYRIALDRPGEERLWLSGDSNQAPSSSTPDGRRIVFDRTDAKGTLSIWIRDLDGNGEAARLGSASASESNGDVSDVTRSQEVYVRRLDGSGGAIRISNDGGFEPLWRRDGRELFYVDPAGRLVAVPMGAGDPLQAGPPAPLFEARLEESTDRQYDVSADGQRFLLNCTSSTDSAPITVVLNWTALLERRSP